MSTLGNSPQEKIQQHFSVETVRSLLNLENKGIAQLCAQVSLMPKKDAQGKTYFTKDDIEILRRRKNQNERQATVKRSSQVVSNPAEQQVNKSYASTPSRKAVLRNPAVSKEVVQPQIKQVPAVQNNVSAPVQPVFNMDKVVSSLSSMEFNIIDKMSELFEEKLSEKLDEKLDAKLDGMDEVVVELVRCKTENETLRYKMNELNKEVYNLKNELSKYKSLGFGIYIKKNGDSSLL